MSTLFGKRKTIEEVEEGKKLQPKFDKHGLIPVITTNFLDNEVLMHGYMNQEAFEKTIKTEFVHYWSRSRKCLWQKGKTSGLTQKVIEIRIDDDQDSLLVKVKVAGNGASCHVGYRSCFYRKICFQDNVKNKLEFIEKKKIFDPKIVYKNAENPTKL
tara:strand:- start:2087 stop:2557 length:471 start_codon:yes stop_codon:yes gene_type:complete